MLNGPLPPCTLSEPSSQLRLNFWTRMFSRTSSPVAGIRSDCMRTTIPCNALHSTSARNTGSCRSGPSAATNASKDGAGGAVKQGHAHPLLQRNGPADPRLRKPEHFARPGERARLHHGHHDAYAAQQSSVEAHIEARVSVILGLTGTRFVRAQSRPMIASSASRPTSSRSGPTASPSTPRITRSVQWYT